MNTTVIDSLQSHSMSEENKAHVGPNDELSLRFTKYGSLSISITWELVIKANSRLLKLWAEA